jgi:hypothetical protein
MIRLLVGNGNSASDDDDDNGDGSNIAAGSEFDIDIDDDDDVEDDNDADHIDRLISPDDRHRNECGYSCIMAFRGTSTGRKLKRDVCKLGILQLIAGIALILVAHQIGTLKRKLVYIVWICCSIYLMSLYLYFIGYCLCRVKLRVGSFSASLNHN